MDKISLDLTLDHIQTFCYIVHACKNQITQTNAKDQETIYSLCMQTVVI